MSPSVTKFILRILPALDYLLVPLVYPAGWLLKCIRIAGTQRLPQCKNALLNIGVFPIRDHFYEPKFDHRNPAKSFFEDRALPGIDWNISEQISCLDKFTYAEELNNLLTEKINTIQFHFNNEAFEPGDAEYWYQIIRSVKPKTIIEIGSGFSTLIASKAIQANRQEDPGYHCEHLCIEPYKIPWLEKLGPTIIRKRVEDIDLSFFSKLEENDILFVDSSHVIRPQGDVLFEYLEILPALNKGVIVHIHDIFSPKDYPEEWLTNNVHFWNEQYFLEAFLTHNGNWKIIGSLNLLHHKHFEKLKNIAPFLEPEHGPGSFYIQKTS